MAFVIMRFYVIYVHALSFSVNGIFDGMTEIVTTQVFLFFFFLIWCASSCSPKFSWCKQAVVFRHCFIFLLYIIVSIKISVASSFANFSIILTHIENGRNTCSQLWADHTSVILRLLVVNSEVFWSIFKPGLIAIILQNDLMRQDKLNVSYKS